MITKADLNLVWKYILNNESKKLLTRECGYTNNKAMLNNMKTYINKDLSDVNVKENIEKGINKVYRVDEWEGMVAEAKKRKRAEDVLMSSNEIKKTDFSNDIIDQEIAKCVNQLAGLIADKVMMKIKDKNI